MNNVQARLLSLAVIILGALIYLTSVARVGNSGLCILLLIAAFGAYAVEYFRSFREDRSEE